MTSTPGDHVAARYGERTRYALLDLLDFGQLADDLVARGKVAYEGDVALRLAGEAICHRFGAAVNRLSDEFIDAHPQIALRAMKRMRDKVAHNYGIVDQEIVWNTLAHRFPADIAEIRALLKDTGAEG